MVVHPGKIFTCVTLDLAIFVRQDLWALYFNLLRSGYFVYQKIVMGFRTNELCI